MNSTLSDLNAALQKLLMEHFRATTPAADGQPFLAFELGTPIPDETFHLPPDNPEYSPMVALEYMSHQANVAPRIQDGVFFETSNRVDKLYEILLGGSTPVDASGMELLGMVKQSARASFADTLPSPTMPVIDSFRPTHADPVNWYDQSANGNWTKLVLDQFDEPPPPPPPPSGGGGGSNLGGPPHSPFLLMWRPVPQELKPLLAERVSTSGVGKIRAHASAQILNNSIAEPASPAIALRESAHTGVSRLGMARATGALARTSAASSLVARRRLGTDVLVAHDSGVARGLGARLRPSPDRLGAVVGDLPVITAPPAPPVTSDGFSISVEVCLVHLRRPWWADGLMTLNNWFVPTVAKGSLSDGTGNGGTPLSVLPIACVFIRNLAIKARWSDADRANVEGSSHLGAFSLLGRSFDHNSATLSVGGMQSIAWICQPLPVLPPHEPV